MQAATAPSEENNDTRTEASSTGHPHEPKGDIRDERSPTLTSLSVDQPAAPPKEPLGVYLRRERERRNMTLEQIASATKINLKLLHSLESDNYESLPAKPFVRGFITNYARCIGLDPSVLLAEYDSYLDQKGSSRFKHSPEQPHIFVDRSHSSDSSKTWLSIVMGGFLVVGLIVFAVLKPSMKKRHHKELAANLNNADVHTVPLPPRPGEPVVEVKAEKKADPKEEPKVELKVEPKVESKLTPVVSQAENKTPLVLLKEAPKPAAPIATPKVELAKEVKKSESKPEIKKPEVKTEVKTEAKAEAKPESPNSTASIPNAEVKVRLVVKATEDSWIKYQSDDRPVLGYMLKKDKVIHIRARDNIRFVTGNPKGIEYGTNSSGPFQTFKGGQRSLVLPTSLAEKYKDKLFQD